eukprot:1659719-Prymnesium_polylepis.1
MAADWAAITSNSKDAPAGYYDALLATLPVSPETSKVAIFRTWIATKIADAEPLLNDIDVFLCTASTYIRLVGFSAATGNNSINALGTDSCGACARGSDGSAHGKPPACSAVADVAWRLAAEVAPARRVGVRASDCGCDLRWRDGCRWDDGWAVLPVRIAWTQPRAVRGADPKRVQRLTLVKAATGSSEAGILQRGTAAGLLAALVGIGACRRRCRRQRRA